MKKSEINNFLEKKLIAFKKLIEKNNRNLPFDSPYIEGGPQPILLPSILYELELLKEFTYTAIIVHRINYDNNPPYLLWSNKELIENDEKEKVVNELTQDIMKKLPLKAINILSKVNILVINNSLLLPFSLYEKNICFQIFPQIF